MKMKAIRGLIPAILLGMVLSAVAESTQRGDEGAQRQAQARTAEQMTQGEGREDGGDRGSEPSTQAWNHSRSAADILGMDILSTADEKIGEVKDIIVDIESGRLLAMVVSTGGFLDMDRQLSLISPNDLRFDSDGENLRADLRRKQIRSAPRFPGDDVASIKWVAPIGEAQSESTDSGVQERADHREVSQEAQADHADGRPVADSESGEPQPQDGEDNSEEQESGADFTDGSSASSGKSLPVSGVVGMNLENAQGESIGAVEKVYLDLEGAGTIGVVVSTGGFLGMGDRKTLFGLNELRYNSEESIFIVTLDNERLGEVPEYRENEPEAFDALRKRLERSDQSSPGR